MSTPRLSLGGGGHRATAIIRLIHMFPKTAALVAICTVMSVCWSEPVSKAGSVDQVILTQGPYSYSDGGEFSAAFGPASIGATRIAGLTDQQVFCVETNEEFYPGATYFGAISEQIKYNAGQFSPSNQPTMLSEVQWLFYQFTTGSLPNYGDNSRVNDAGALQLAIWGTLGESELFPDPTNGMTAAWMTAASAAVQGGWTNTQSGGTVAIVNLWSSYQGGILSGNAQDQLVMLSPGTPAPKNVFSPTPVPLPSAGCQCLALLSAAGLARRFMSRKSPSTLA